MWFFYLFIGLFFGFALTLAIFYLTAYHKQTQVNAAAIRSTPIIDTTLAGKSVAAAVLASAKERKSDTKKNGRANEFKLTRDDVLEYTLHERTLFESDHKRVLPSVLFKKKSHFCDSLHCGEWCFALMYEKSGSLKLTIRLDEKLAEQITKFHTLHRAAFPKGKNWYDFVIDSTFTDKKEVFDILDISFAFVLKRHYNEEDGGYTTDDAAARRDSQQIKSALDKNHNN
jgi:predicted DNA-binding protein (MmcQ/YjbR family)